jgi:hypothetical protein
MSSITSQSRSSSGTRSFSSHSVIAHPSRSGAAVSSRTSPDPGAVWRKAPSTNIQNRCGSRSCRPTGTHAALSARSASPVHDRSKTVFPLPGGADTTVTRADASSRPNSPGRDTTPPAPGRATRPGRDPMPGQGPWPDHHTTRPGKASRHPVWPFWTGVADVGCAGRAGFRPTCVALPGPGLSGPASAVGRWCTGLRPGG